MGIIEDELSDDLIINQFGYLKMIKPVTRNSSPIKKALRINEEPWLYFSGLSTVVD